MAIHLTQTS